MLNKTRVSQLRIRAFTMLESLFVLGIASVLAFALSGSVQTTFAAVEEQIFFMEFIGKPRREVLLVKKNLI